MVGCSAANCRNNTRHGIYKFYKFPTDLNRFKKWVINSGRKYWDPTSTNVFCNVHFEESQFEQNRIDGRKRLKPNAVPTIFNDPDKPSLIDCSRSVYKRKNTNMAFEKLPTTSLKVESPEASFADITTCGNCQESKQELIDAKTEVLHLKQELFAAKKEIEGLKQKSKKHSENLLQFLSEEQIQSLSNQRKEILSWSDASILKGFKLRFALGKKGYIYLRKTGYPCPAYSTLNRRFLDFKINFGVLENVFSLLQEKVASMKTEEKDCVVMVDAMDISENLDSYNKCLVGNDNNSCNHLTIAVLHGMNTNWKQIVSIYVTGASTSGFCMKNLLLKVIAAAHNMDSTPLALAARRVVKSIVSSQFMAYVKNSNYQANSDYALLDNSHIMSTLQPTTSSNSDEACKTLSELHYNSVHYLTCACVNTVLCKKIICKNCKLYLTTGDQVSSQYLYTSEYSDLGGLNIVPRHILNIFVYMEQKILNKQNLLATNEICMNEIIQDVMNTFANIPACHLLLKNMTKHYATIRSRSLKKFLILKRKSSTSMRSNSCNKKRKNM